MLPAADSRSSPAVLWVHLFLNAGTGGGAVRLRQVVVAWETSQESLADRARQTPCANDTAAIGPRSDN